MDDEYINEELYLNSDTEDGDEVKDVLKPCKTCKNCSLIVTMS